MASNLLWAHILRKDATATADTPSQIPPIAPQDKTGTSMRMLIHDTQVNLEKFSTRLDGLLQRVDDCRAEVVNANKLLDVERDKILTEILELANRCQSEMKAHVGTPAQTAAVELVHVSQVSTEKSVQALEKRIDALQGLLQAHATAMKSIQDQQNTLIGAILPLVPILHSVSPQMDQIKTALSDMVANAVSTITSSLENVRSILVSEFVHGHRCAQSSSTRAGPSNKSTSSSRRKRQVAPSLGPQESNIFPSSPLDNRSYDEPRPRLKRARTEDQEENVLLPRKFPRLTVPPTNPGDRTPLLRTPRTPRQPLADLSLPSGGNPSVRNHVPTHMASAFREYMRTLEARWAVGNSSTVTNSTLRPNFQLEHAVPLQDTTTVRRRFSAVHAANESAMALPCVPGPSDQDALSKATKIEEITEMNATGVISVHSSPLSSPPSSVRQTSRDPSTRAMQQHLRKNTIDLPRFELFQVTDPPRVEVFQVAPPLPDPISSNLEVSPPKSMSLRDRRAQMSRFGRTETRRFIPVEPWSDEEE